MTSHAHDRCSNNTCGHSHGTAGHAADEGEDFNEFLEETHPCCQKDSEARARAMKLRAALDKVDPSQMAERARKAAFSSGAPGMRGIPRMGGDYPALREARSKTAAAAAAAVDSAADDSHGGGAGGISGPRDSEDSDDHDDDDLDYLLDDPEITRLAQARVEGIHADAARLEKLRALGFGLHSEVSESEVEAACDGCFRGAAVVLHLYDPDSKLGASLDLFLEAKAGSYIGTRFLRCRLRPDSAAASRMRVRKVPALACYKGGVRVAYTDQLTQFGDNSEGVDPGAIDRWLAASGTLVFDPPDINALRSRSGEGEEEEDDDEGAAEARYDCGLDGCHKTFKHNHFLAAGGGGLPSGFGERL